MLTVVPRPLAGFKGPTSKGRKGTNRKQGRGRLGWPGWLVTYRNKCPAPGIEPGHGHPSQH